MSYKAAIIFALQIIITLIFSVFAVNVPQNNSLNNFTVSAANLEEDYKIFLENFAGKDVAILSIELSEKCSNKLQYVEDIVRKISCEEQVSYLSFLSQIPNSLQFQIFNEVESDKIEKELLFPFIKDNYYSALLLFDRNSNLEVLVGNIVEKIEFFKLYQSDIKNIVIIGEPVVNYYLGQSSLEVRNKFFPAIIMFCALIMIFVFRSIKVLFAWLLAIVSSLTVSMGIFALSGNELNLITNLIPVLIFVLSTAMHMHILLSLTKFSSLRRGLLDKLIPNFLVTLTTSIGFGSLMTSEVKPIYLLGLYTSLSVWFIFIFCYVTHLGFSVIFSLQLYNKKFHLLPSKMFTFSGRGSIFILVIPICAILLGGIAIEYNNLESNGIHYFSLDHPLRKNTAMIEEHISGSSSIEILIPTNGELIFDLEKYEKIYLFEKKLKALPQIHHIVSLCQYIQFAQKSNIGFDYYDDDSMKSIEENVLITLQQEIIESNSQAISELVNDKYYRLQVVCSSLNSDNYDGLKQKIYDFYQETGLPKEIIVTGALERIIQIQKYLLSSLKSSLTITIISSILLMSLFLKNLHIVYLSIIPNLFPLGAMGGLLYVVGFPTTIATVMVFSIAFGIAVDSTIHLFHCYSEKTSKNYQERWNYSLEMNAAAITITTIVLLGAFSLIGVLSSFIPISHFGILLAFGMLAAWIGDLFFLPITLRICKWL